MAIKEMAVQLVLKFLKDKGFIQSLLNLETEAKINLQDYPKEIQFFKKILLKGDFNQAVQFIWTFEQKIPSTTLKKLTLQIYKQKLYELLENPNQSQLRNLFEKQIINVCSQDEYQHLFTLLTCRSVKQIPGMDTWSALKGRFSCFQQIQPFLQSCFNMTHYQKTVNNVPAFNLQQAIESYLSAQNKAYQRLDKHLPKGKHFATDKQSKQSIQSKSLKYENQSKAYNEYNKKKSEPSSSEKIQQNQLTQKSSIQKQPYINVSSNIIKNNISNNANVSKIGTKGTFQPSKRSQVQQLQMSESKIQKSQYPQRIQKSSIEYEKQENVMQGSTFSKKYNPYMANIGNSNSNINPSGYQKAKDEIRYSGYPLKVTEMDSQQKITSYKQVMQKQRQKQFQRQRQYGKYSDKYMDKKQTNGSFNILNSKMNMNKQYEKDSNDSQLYQEQVRKNIAYLDQNNNSVVYKDDDNQNQNFTFSNGAEESSANDKNRRILKLTSFNDPKAIRTCQFSPSGTLFALGTNSSYLKIYDIQQLIQTNQPKQINPISQIPQLHAKSIFCLDWSSNQKSIATCSNDLTIKITEFTEEYGSYNYKTNVIGRHESCIRMVKFNELENKLVSCGDDSLLKVWDIGKIKKCTTLKGHTNSISAFRFSSNQQDNIIYSVSKDCTVRKWDIRVGQCITVSSVQQSQLTFIANHIDRIVVSHKNGNVSFFSQQLKLEHSAQIHEQEIRSIDGTSYDDLLLTSSFDGHISIFTQKTAEAPNYHQHNENQQDKVVFATFLNHPQFHGFASTSTLGICNIYSYQ